MADHSWAADTIHLTVASGFGGRVCWPSVAVVTDEQRNRHTSKAKRNDSLWRPLPHPPAKTAKSAWFLQHVCLPARNSAPHCTDFHEIRLFALFTKNRTGKFHVPLKSDKNNGHFTEHPCIFMVISRSIFLTARNISDRKLYIKSKHTFYAW